MTGAGICIWWILVLCLEICYDKEESHEKRLASAVLAVALLLSSVPGPFFAEEMADDKGMILSAETPEPVDTPAPTVTPEPTVTPGAPCYSGTGGYPVLHLPGLRLP